MSACLWHLLCYFHRQSQSPVHHYHQQLPIRKAQQLHHWSFMCWQANRQTDRQTDRHLYRSMSWGTRRFNCWSCEEGSTRGLGGSLWGFYKKKKEEGEETYHQNCVQIQYLNSSQLEWVACTSGLRVWSIYDVDDYENQCNSWTLQLPTGNGMKWGRRASPTPAGVGLAR